MTTSAIGAVIAAFGNSDAFMHHGESLQKMKEYEQTFFEYAKQVEKDMKATQRQINIFDQAELMLSEEIPYNQKKWKSMIKYIKDNHPDADDESISFNKMHQ